MSEPNSAFLRRFDFAARGTTLRREVAGGVTTFLALSYILFVQPSLMAAAGIPVATALVATCVGSAFACVLMGWLANYPIALAPGMGHNVFFAFTVCGPAAAGGLGLTWQQALAAVVCSGSLFVLLAAFRFRERILEAIPESLQHAIAAGIGLLIALLGLEWGGLVRAHPVTLVQLGDLASPVSLLTVFGLALTVALIARGVRAALLISIAATLAAAVCCGQQSLPERILSFDIEYQAVAFDLDFAGLFAAKHFVEVVLVLLFLDVFDTVGTLVGVGARGGFLEGGKLDAAGPALLSDALGTVAGGLLGTSTITSYVESAAGVTAGARTGFASFVTAACLLLAIPFQPLIALVGAGVTVDGATFHPVLAPALIAVGAMMATSAAKIRFDDPVAGLPAFLAMVMIPLTFSITEGIAIGFVAASLAALASGSPRRLAPLTHLLAAAFVGWYLLRHRG